MSFVYRTKSGNSDFTGGTAITNVDREAKSSKYKNKKAVVDGICFDSQAEAQRYKELVILQKACIIQKLELQVPFLLIPKNKGEQAVKYIADFCYIENGVYVVEDVKGYRTDVYKLKRKLFKYIYRDYEFREVEA